MADGLVFVKKGVDEYSLEELLGSEAEFLGQGTFGSTYKAFLENGDIVAVKRFKGEFSLGIDKEKVEVLGSIVHENLQPLIAYRYTKHEMLLLCDYMPNGSLFTLLHGSRGTNRTPLSWKIRKNIAYGVARGIEYLHSQGPNVCHGNIKSSNVFLDNFYNASVSEFGIAQLVTSETKTKIGGGYCAPEVKTSNEVSQEGDVYNFGVVLLELLTGKDPINNGGVELAKWVRLMFEEKPVIDVFDNEVVKDQSSGEQMMQMLQLAICCTFEYPSKRPSMAIVIWRIKEICKFGP